MLPRDSLECVALKNSNHRDMFQLQMHQRLIVYVQEKRERKALLCKALSVHFGVSISFVN